MRLQIDATDVGLNENNKTLQTDPQIHVIAKVIDMCQELLDSMRERTLT